MFTDQRETDKPDVPFSNSNFLGGEKLTTRSLPIDLLVNQKMNLIENIFLSISRIVKSFPWQNRVKRSPGLISELGNFIDRAGKFFTEKLGHLSQLCDFMKNNLR